MTTNLIKVGHEHGYNNVNTQINSFGVGRVQECPAGHSACQADNTTYRNVTRSISNTGRNTSLNYNLTSKTHLHVANKKTPSDANVIVLPQTNDPQVCGLNHSWCAFFTDIEPITYKLVTLSGLANVDTSGFSGTNLTKFSSHTHTVADALVQVDSSSWYLQTPGICGASHSDCVFSGSHISGINTLTITDSTTDADLI